MNAPQAPQQAQFIHHQIIAPAPPPPYYPYPTMEYGNPMYLAPIPPQAVIYHPHAHHAHHAAAAAATVSSNNNGNNANMLNKTLFVVLQQGTSEENLKGFLQQ